MQTQGRPPTTPFPPLDESPVATCLGAGHGSIPRPPWHLRCRGKAESRLRWRHMPPPATHRWTLWSGDSFCLAPASSRGAGLSPPGFDPGSALLTVGLPVRAGARSPLGTRLGPGSPNRATSAVCSRALPGIARRLSLIPPLFRGGSLGPATPMKRARQGGLFQRQSQEPIWSGRLAPLGIKSTTLRPTSSSSHT